MVHLKMMKQWPHSSHDLFRADSDPCALTSLKLHVLENFEKEFIGEASAASKISLLELDH